MVTKPQGETPIGPGRDIPKKMVSEYHYLNVLNSKECIPEQGEVKKKTTGLNKEWRKKYLVLGEETLTYYPSIQVSLLSYLTAYSTWVIFPCVDYTINQCI